MKMILVGPPGAGKGTISEFLKREYGIVQLSTGDILREEMEKGTENGKLATELAKEGKLVPDDVILAMVKDALKKMEGNYLLDGFPRTVFQAKAFQEMLNTQGEKIDLVIEVSIDDNLVIDRIVNRVNCPRCKATYHTINRKPKVEGICDHCSTELTRRKDDSNEEAVRNRVALYHSETEPLLELFQEQGIVRTLNTECSIEEMCEKVKGFIEEVM